MEANNMKAMRDALSDACYAMFNFLKTQSGGYEEMANALDKAKVALAMPPRNCDRFREVDDAYNQFMRYVQRENPAFTKTSPLHTVWDALRWVLDGLERQKEGGSL